MTTERNYGTIETAWSFGPGEGSSGGVIPSVPIPYYQLSIAGVNGASSTNRNAPDVSAQAAGGNIILNGSLQNWFGTSQAAPLWAGFMALVNEQAANFGVASVGFANPALYVLQSDNSFGPSFHDVVSGCNPNHANNQYCAGPGYDLVTGLGSPQSGLINGLISPSPNQCQEFLASLRVLIQNRRVPVGEVAGDRLQLKQCLQEGQITQAEYDTTLAALNALAQ